jgi:hypothetical protein
MSAPANKGKGKGIAFLRALVGHQGDECVSWPMCGLRGYGFVAVNGVVHYAHRLMCELAYGPPPTPEHQAAHSCGNGHQGCVNPRHISWKTVSENMLDKRKHGTQYTRKTRFKLTPEQVAEIRSLTGPIAPMAARFGVCESNIRHIRAGRSWKTGKREYGGFSAS